MPSLRAGLVVRKPTPAATVAAIEQAEARGVAAVWSTVGGATPDAVTLFAAAGARTTRIGLGTAIVPTYPRHPVALASQALAIEGLAPGRFRLGIGPSHRPTMEGSLGLAMGKPLDHLREYLTILRGLLWEGKTDFDGTYFHVHTALPPDVAPPRTPVPISALRVNAFSLAGEIADGAISWVCPVPYLSLRRCRYRRGPAGGNPSGGGERVAHPPGADPRRRRGREGIDRDPRGLREITIAAE
ncbi:MAG: LLM class flavin-dependent oxidoreductase [Thermomicrobia bacterium]|nr:LLM class flavin-dependent oxidoreductase [Thermomicrobia bacterium]